MQANNQFHQPLPILTELQRLYPGIEEELGNRHSHSYGMLKKKFCRQFPDCQPQFYVNVKGIARLLSVRHTRFELTMALENGITLLVGVAVDSPNIEIKLSEDIDSLVLARDGTIARSIEGQEEYSGMIAQAYSMGCSMSPPQRLRGACIFYDNNLGLSSLSRDEETLLAFIIAALVVNEQLNNHPQDLVYELCESLTERECPRYSLYSNYMLGLSGKYWEEVSLNCGGLKLVVSDLFMVQQEAKALSALNRKSLVELRLLEKLLSKDIGQAEDIDIVEALSGGLVSQQFQSSLHQSYSLEQVVELLGEKPDLPSDSLFYPRRKLETSRQQFTLIRELMKKPNRNGLLQSITLSYQLKRQQQLVPERIQSFLAKCMQHCAYIPIIFSLACTLIESKYALLLVDCQCLYILFDFIKKELMLDPDGNELIEDIHSHIFSTLPSRGVGVLDPSQQIWFFDDD